MKTRILGAVSALAMMVAVTAYAETNSVGASAEVRANQSTTTEEFKQGLENAKDGIVSTTKGVGNAAKEAVMDIKAKVIGEDGQPADLSVRSSTTAKGMIGQPIYNTQDEKIGTVKDIILNADGEARLIVVSDGGFMGIGDKLAAFDYDLVSRQEANGDVIMPLSEDTIKKVAAFSYDPKEASDTVQVIPANGYSVAELLKGKLVNPKDESVANIENITFSGGEADNVLVSFNEKLGMGGDNAAIDFDDLQLVKSEDNALSFRMNARQSAEFDAFRNGKSTQTN